MDDNAKMESHLSSAAAFVKGGVQEACDDACSICLEAFCDSDPSTVTGCKHEFHLQCILEWCQRSSQCPMCWQPITLKDPSSQELLEGVEHERSFRFNQSQNATIFHHPALGDFELQLPVGTSDSELEERIIQHLAAAAAMGRARHIARREGYRRSGPQGRPQFLVFSAPPTAPFSGLDADVDQSEENYPRPVNALAGSSISLTPGGEEAGHQIPHVSSSEIQVPSSHSLSDVISATRPGHSNNRNSAGQSTPVNEDSGGPSDFQSFSESLKSQFISVSMRCKESITKSTRGWKERFFSRNSSVADLGSEVRREVQAGIASVSRMMERLDTRENNRNNGSLSQSVEGHSIPESRNLRIVARQSEATPNASNTSGPSVTSSGSV